MGDHKFHQHDADTADHQHGDPELVEDLDALLGSAMTPEEYLAQHPEAIASAVDQAQRVDG